MPTVLNHCVNLNTAFSYSEVSVSSSIVICITHIVDTYMVPSSATVSQGGRYLYSHFIDEETEGQPQLMHFDRVSNPPFCLQVHILTHHSVLGAHLCSQEMFILVLSQQLAKDEH